MLSPRKRSRVSPVSSATSYLGRRLCTRRPLMAVVIILIVCILIQTFITQWTWHDKVNGLQHHYLSKQKLFKSLRTLIERPSPKSLLAGKPDLKSQQNNRTAYLHNEKPLNLILSDETLPPHTDLMIEGIQLSPGETGSINKPRAELSHYFVPQSTWMSLFAEATQRIPPTSPTRTYSETTCQPKSHIVFLKTHKTGSSTILNILYRYGESRNLTFALPVKKHMQLFYPNYFAKHFVEGVMSHRVKEFHIMCNHMRFRKSEVSKVMPEDAFYFSILRHPVAMMESIYTYYKNTAIFRRSVSLDNLLDSCLTSYKPTLSKHNFAHNALAFDFGLNNNIPPNADDLEEKASVAIAAIENDFHLILISEYFDESLILLKHALCWSLEDVLSFKLNSRSDKSRQPLSPNTAEKIKKWNALDWRIYLHFNATFWKTVERLVGEEQMKKEVSALRELQAKLAKICLKDGRAVDPSQLKDRKLKPYQSGKAVIQGYNLNPLIDNQTKQQCLRLITPELQYTKLLYNQQFPDLHY